ncbi:glycogen debranching N-terminal domain-containing protein [Paenarthrobacter sp. NPDC089714]|uniref:amylo-alpha-1,6-glucosidase n=1 Tax=Paenarthrobacter sp. NPDC089714 TaxID=3364377 RepID=UPI0038127BCA
MVGWNADTAAGSVGTGAVTLVEGSSFCISQISGDIHPDFPHGLFQEDTRIVSLWTLAVNGQQLEALAAELEEPYRAHFAGRVPRADGVADSSLIVERLREVGRGLLEQIVVKNYSSRPVECVVSVTVAADFADLFEVKEARVQRPWQQTRHMSSDTLTIRALWGGLQKGIAVRAPGAEITPEALIYRSIVPARGHWSATLTVSPVISAGSPSASSYEHPDPKETAPRNKRWKEWVDKIPVVQVGNRAIERTLRRSYDDLGSLRVEDPDHPERVVVAAGAPWFMALFGRDSLMASIMAMAVDPSLALGTVQTLADRQGKTVDPATEEEPGKILHEVRFDVSTSLALGGKSAYYGSIDATPLFVIVLGEVSRWGFASETINALLPHADRALDWIRDFGDKDGDGFVEYERLNDRGLINQGWKDSWDGISFADGRLAEAPIALCEVQGYVYGAYMARAWMAQANGDTDYAADLQDRALKLKKRFNERFWLPERGYYAVALDRDKRPVDACTSNIGHCLWNGIVEQEKAGLVAARLMSPEMFSGWGVRTLATDMGAYNPASYHNGSVWPHDNAIVQAGLLRYGFVEPAQRISTALLDAADFSGGRLPELFCGFPRGEFAAPVPYPTACSPQAWAATTPIYLVTNLMRYNPHVSMGGLWIDPVLPASYGSLRIENAPMAGSRITIEISGANATIEGLPQELTLHHGTRPWMAELVEQSLGTRRTKGPPPNRPF